MAEKILLTYAGLKKYEDELRDLKVNRRQEIAQKIKIAREQGDLSENADYDAAKEEQGEIESRIAELEEILKNADIVADEDFDSAKVNVGCEIKLLDIEYDEELTYQIVGSAEADCLHNKISNVSPIGSAVMGHTIGDLVDVQSPGGEHLKFKILSISRI